MEVGTGIVGSAFLTIKTTKELIMPKPVTRGTYNNCSECNIKMKDVAFTRSVAKLCPECRGDIASNNIEVRKIYKELKQKRKNAGIEIMMTGQHRMIPELKPNNYTVRYQKYLQNLHMLLLVHWMK